MTDINTDVVIMGGGLAGLTLALQIKSGRPELDIVIIEKNSFPVPEAVAKIGESTVEIGSHYLTETIGLQDHFKNKHLKKFGIRCFFGQPETDLSNQDELGASQVFDIPTYQIDRGVLENHLVDVAKKADIRILEGSIIEKIDLSSTKKVITDKHKITGKWLMDCAGRQFLLKNKLQLEKSNDHEGNAVWFRIDKRIEVDSWSTNSDWQAACEPQGRRWLSTNHLMGPGYWVWIIPLASGVTSIGIVMDDTAYENAEISDIQSAQAWLNKNQKRLADEIEGAKFLDFAAIKGYSYACKQTFSNEGWGISGEAGFFADPFYSPGTDFIAFSNSFLTKLVLLEAEGKDTQVTSMIYQKLFRSFYENTLSIYQQEYGGFGDRKLMGLKLLWDYSYYWGILSLIFFQNTFSNIDFMRENNAKLMAAQKANQTIQALFRDRAKKRLVLPNAGVFMNQYQIPCLRHFNKVLLDTNPENHAQNLNHNAQMLETIADCVTRILNSDSPTIESDEEKNLLADYRKQLVA